MPLEFCFVPKGEAFEVDNGLIEAGEGIFLTEYVEGSKEIIAISCNTNDDGGKIDRLSPAGKLAVEGVDFIEADEMPPSLETIYLPEGESHEIPITGRDDIEGTLIIRYIEPHTITPSGLIPASLSFHQ